MDLGTVFRKICLALKIVLIRNKLGLSCAKPSQSWTWAFKEAQAPPHITHVSNKSKTSMTRLNKLWLGTPQPQLVLIFFISQKF